MMLILKLVICKKNAEKEMLNAICSSTTEHLCHSLIKIFKRLLSDHEMWKHNRLKMH